MRTLVLVVVLTCGAAACGGGAKPPMQPDNDPVPAGDGGVDPSAPAPAATPAPH
jgi:hypothetical protein